MDKYEAEVVVEDMMYGEELQFRVNYRRCGGRGMWYGNFQCNFHILCSD